MALVLLLPCLQELLTSGEAAKEVCGHAALSEARRFCGQSSEGLKCLQRRFVAMLDSVRPESSVASSGGCGADSALCKRKMMVQWAGSP